MPRLPRRDRPGRWFHVFNRGLARRPVFETLEDVRVFLACLACAVRRGEIEIHAYCILTTHFHLIVRSPTGSLSVAMERVMNAYVRYYNRTRRRDGSLFRGRFGARPVDSRRYRWTLFRYVDRNPVQARLVALPWQFPHGSAIHYVAERRPPWLSTGWMEEQLRRQGFDDPREGYRSLHATALARWERSLVQARMRAPANLPDDLDDLLEAAPPQVLAWMRRKAKLADGCEPGLPSLDAGTVVATIEREKASGPSWTHATGRGRRNAWPFAEAWLLRQLAAAGFKEIAGRLEIGTSAAQRRVQKAARLIEEDAAFAERLAGVARRALDGAWPRGPGRRRPGAGVRGRGDEGEER